MTKIEKIAIRYVLDTFLSILILKGTHSVPFVE